MESSETPTPPAGNPPAADERISGEEIRRASFPQALRGYDREAVHDLLDRVADWVEGKAGAVADAAPGMREELAKVGERTAGILTAAEEAAAKIRAEAKEYADKLRSEADAESRKSRLNASQRMDEMIAEAEVKSQQMIDEAVARRRQLNQAISSLIDRRDEIAGEAAKLAEELLHAVEGLRTPAPAAEPDEPAAPEPGLAGVPSVAEEPSDEMPSIAEEPSEEIDEIDESEEMTVVHEPDFSEPDTKDLPQGPSPLLVDPDDEDQPPPSPRRE
jgi:DivIVA domain-containing protein